MTQPINAPLENTEPSAPPMNIYSCNNCGTVYLYQQQVNGMNCPACGSAGLLLEASAQEPLPAEFFLPFSILQSSLSDIYTDFVKDVRFAPDELTTSTLLSRTQPIFFPMWLVDCIVEGEWQAEMGFNYQVKSSREHFSGSDWQSQDVIEERVRWEKRLGTLVRAYHNHAVPALHKFHARLDQIGQYDLTQATVFEAGQSGSVIIEKADLSPNLAWHQAKALIDESAAEECRKASAAQHVRNFNISADYNDRQWTQLLLPMYAAWYRDDDNLPHVVSVNAQSGRIYGVRMASAKKGRRRAGNIALLALGLFLLALIAGLLGRIVTAFNTISIVLILASVITAFSVLSPLTWSARWNRNQKG